MVENKESYLKERYPKSIKNEVSTIIVTARDKTVLSPLVDTVHFF